MRQYRIERRLSGEDWQCLLVSTFPMSISSIGAPNQDDSSPHTLRGLPGAELRTRYGERIEAKYIWSPLYPRNPADYDEGFIWGWKVIERNAVEAPHDMALDLSMTMGA